MTWTVLQGDWAEVLATMPDNWVQACVTSPPYWGLRDYGVPGQLGLEPTPEEYVEKLVAGFRQVRRVLRDDGLLWLNLGDTYASHGGHSDTACRDRRGAYNIGNRPEHDKRDFRARPGSTLKPKDLVGIPWRVALALQADGWWLRQDIIWHKPNPMPESVTDRCTKAHEYIFLLSKSGHYFFDAEAIKEPATRGFSGSTFTEGKTAEHLYGRASDAPRMDPGMRNKRSVWTIGTEAFPEAHFATFPQELVRPCVLASTSAVGECPNCGEPWERLVQRRPMVVDKSPRQAALGDKGKTVVSGTVREPASSETVGWMRPCGCDYEPPRAQLVLDPFCGTGTTGMVSLGLGRSFIGVELSPKYVEMAKRRIEDDAPLFNRAGGVR